MPLYEYKCPRCGRVDEVLQSFSAPPPECSCPGKLPVVMEKQISRSTGIVLVGEGWYRDHYGLKTGGER